MTASYRIGIDVGGTFTDLILLNEITGQTFSHKVSSTPSMPHKAPIRGVKELFEKHDVKGDEVSFIGLGTTVATNAFLENKVAPTALITTRGFKDLLEIARQQRPGVYDPFKQKAPVPVKREMRFEVSERVDASGKVLVPLDEDELRDVFQQAKAAGAQSVAICFLNSYVNAAHENRAFEIGKALWSEAHISTSSEVMREFREYERFLSTVINVSLTPLLQNYFLQFRNEVKQLGINVEPLIMSSSGGVFSCDVASSRPIDTLFSGPSGGVSSTIHLGQTIDKENLITFDMGGTSTEVCAIQNLRPQKVFARTISAYPVKVASYDIHTIGAGGSSIASVDEGGSLFVGPASAGADPGPACYARGGEQATVTDANVVLGRLNPDYLLAGTLAIDCAESYKCIDHHIGSVKQTSSVLSALSVVALAEANMAQAIRVVSVEKGLDPSSFSLVALGGAGPLHAATVAKEVGMQDVIIPQDAGVFCALGVLTKDIQTSRSQTVLLSDSNPDAQSILDKYYRQLEQDAREELEDQGYCHTQIQFNWSADVRYGGQNHEITIDVPRGAFDQKTIDTIRATFHDAHAELFGYRLEDSPITFVTLRMDGMVPIARPVMEEHALTSSGVTPLVQSHREVYFDGHHVKECPVYERATLSSGDTLNGPAIIEQMDSTTIVPPDFQARVDSWQNIIITW